MSLLEQVVYQIRRFHVSYWAEMEAIEVGRDYSQYASWR